MTLTDLLSDVNNDYINFYAEYKEYAHKVCDEVVEIIFTDEIPADIVRRKTKEGVEYSLSAVELTNGTVEIERTVYVTEKGFIDIGSDFRHVFNGRHVRIRATHPKYNHRIQTLMDVIAEQPIKPKHAIAFFDDGFAYLRDYVWERIYA